MPEGKTARLATHSRARIEMTALSPFVMDNIRGADPDDALTIQINELTTKGSRMTPEERDIKEALQWRRCLYQDGNGRLVYPYRNLIVALAEAGAAYKAKTAIIERGAVLPEGMEMAFGFEGPNGTSMEGVPLDTEALKALYDDHRYRLRAFVNGNPSGGKRKSMVPRMRPVFQKWWMNAEVTVFHDDLGRDDFEKITAVAGRQGLGNARKIGNGRFTVKVEWLPARVEARAA